MIVLNKEKASHRDFHESVLLALGGHSDQVSDVVGAETPHPADIPFIARGIHLCKQVLEFPWRIGPEAGYKTVNSSEEGWCRKKVGPDEVFPGKRSVSKGSSEYYKQDYEWKGEEPDP